MGTYNVHAGHNRKCPGASKYLDEVTENRKVASKVISLLRAAGHTVYDCTDDAGATAGANLANIVAKCNRHNVDLDISIHLNAGGGTGVEVLYYPSSSKGKSMATTMSAAVASALGLRNRGPKPRSNLYVLKNTKATAVLVECCFVDSTTDKNKWNVDACAKAIVEAATGKAVTSSGSSSSSSKPSSGSSSSSSSSSSNAIKVDGWWGPATTRRLQQIFGTTVDGEVSNQFSCYRNENPGLDSGWDWQSNPSGYSPLIKAIQKKVGATQDGHIGPKTIKAIQRWMGTTQDGHFSGPSVCIKALQRWINKQ